MPGAAVLGARHEWPREPLLCKPVPCYLCGKDFDSKDQLLAHWRDEHVALPEREKQLFTDHRIEEDMRKRVLYDEAFSGPFEVRGQEMRRTVGVHTAHATQSLPGQGRCLGGCAVCARSFWLEDLYDLHLFTKPSVEKQASVEAAPSRVGGHCDSHNADKSGSASGRAPVAWLVGVGCGR